MILSIHCMLQGGPGLNSIFSASQAHTVPSLLPPLMLKKTLAPALQAVSCVTSSHRCEITTTKIHEKDPLARAIWPAKANYAPSK